jgi:hypothetical protein
VVTGAFSGFHIIHTITISSVTYVLLPNSHGERCDYCTL